VEVIRRLYRSGESEYLIDGQQCRLKDVHELLMDTGLGAKAYAIIEQGKIGMILSSRPADRRQLIEEAAGITKYKARRRAAELKLEAAQQNLTRIDDIVFEVEKQRGTLRRQAAKARRYKRLRDELRRWEKVLIARRSRELAAAIEAARAHLSDARGRESAAAAHVAELEGTVSRLRIELAEAESRATAAREAAHARELDAQRRQQQVELDRQQAAILDTRSGELDVEIAALEARRDRASRPCQSAAPPPSVHRRSCRRPQRRSRRHRRPMSPPTASSKGSRATSRPLATRCSRLSTARPPCSTSSRTPRAPASASPTADPARAWKRAIW
jgi:chromosome segregation protein